MQTVRELYRVEQLPIFQNRMHDTAQEARQCPRGNIRLVQNLATGLIYNDDFRPELMIYDEHYQNEQAVSATFQHHLLSVSEIVGEAMGQHRLVEVGCGKGYFLEMLCKQGFDVIGFDPSYEGSNPRVRRHYFTPEIGMRASGLILRHVLEHIQNPLAFIQNLRHANGGEGLIYIEVPCFDWICKQRAWFDIFYEHVNYFRICDFERMFGRILNSGHLFGGQYLYVIADMASLTIPNAIAEDLIEFPKNFSSEVDLYEITKDKQIAVWGGASKGVIFALLSERLGRPIDIVIDINPAKQGKFLPGTGVRVQSPQEALAKLDKKAVIFVMNSNYLSEIIEMTNNEFEYIGVDSERL